MDLFLITEIHSCNKILTKAYTMLIRFIWKKCDFSNKDCTIDEVDTYWVEATKHEAETDIFPKLPQKYLEKAIAIAEAWRHEPNETNQADRTYGFLVSKDLEHIYPCQINYPFHQLWNGYSPFEEFPPTYITDLNEIYVLKKSNGNVGKS